MKWRYLRPAMDAALVALYLTALAMLVGRAGHAWGLAVAAAAVAVFLAASIVDQIQVREGSARLVNRHGQEMEVGR